MKSIFWLRGLNNPKQSSMWSLKSSEAYELVGVGVQDLNFDYYIFSFLAK